jgi:hypothetical protein
MEKRKIKKIIGKYFYILEDSIKVDGDWVISKHQLEKQIGDTEEYINGLFSEKQFQLIIDKINLFLKTTL